MQINIDQCSQVDNKLVTEASQIGLAPGKPIDQYVFVFDKTSGKTSEYCHFDTERFNDGIRAWLFKEVCNTFYKDLIVIND